MVYMIDADIHCVNMDVELYPQCLCHGTKISFVSVDEGDVAERWDVCVNKENRHSLSLVKRPVLL